MAAFFPVTDSLTGEPVIVNVDQVRTIAERTDSEGHRTTVIGLHAATHVQAEEDLNTICNLFACLDVPYLPPIPIRRP